MTTSGILKLNATVREALEQDDQLILSGLKPIYCVRDFPDWRAWSDLLEAELDKRAVKYAKVGW